MATGKFEITDYYDLLNLHKALLEAKFHENPDNKLVSGSPIIARFCNEIVDLLSSQKSEWQGWRVIKTQKLFMERAIINAVSYYASSDEWAGLTCEEKTVQAKNYTSPFICDDEDIDQFIETVTDRLNKI